MIVANKALKFTSKRIGVRRVLTVAILIVLAGCSKENPSPAESRNLVEYSVVGKRTASQLQLLAQLSGTQIDPAALKYDVTIYKVTYTTTYKDNQVNASGLVILPYSTGEKFPTVSVQHGTIVEHADAPSVQSADDYEVLLYSALGSAGFVTVVPDYIGFGASKDILHPYYVEQPTADAIVDNVRAARNLAGDKNVTLDDRLFLAGYSEGGYATLAAHKKIDEKGLARVNLVASFPAAGGYDISAMQRYFFSLSSYGQPFYLAYVLKAYEEFYGFTSALSDVFADPYANRASVAFTGSMSSSQINAQLSTNIQTLIKPEALTNMTTDPKYNYLIKAFEENSLTDWVPKAKIFFYHGDADEVVPYENSVSTVDKLLGRAASPSAISLTTLPGKTHSTGGTPFFEAVIRKLLELR